MTFWNQILSLTLSVLMAGSSLTAQMERRGEGTGAPMPEVTPAAPQPPPEAPILLLPEASDVLVEENARAVVDYSNTADGYVMVLFSAVTDQRLKARVTGPSTQYTYDLPAGEWTTFPLSDGDGAYQVSVYENIEGDSYRTTINARFDVKLSSPLAPFLRPNQYVNYENAPETLAKAAQLTAGTDSPAERVEKVYRFLVKELRYDKEKAENVKSGYLPVLDKVLREKKGICFDYAALMAAMLRSQDIPCRLVVGNAGRSYHAWVEVWDAAAGVWTRMDPTFAASGEEVSGVKYTPQFYY